MNWQLILQQLANLTTAYNNLITQARKIWQLPWQNVLKPASKIHVSNTENSSEFITVQQILDAALSYRKNQLISATVSVDGNDVTVDSGASWVINNVNYETTSDTVINVAYAATGYTRNDILVANEANVIYRLIGPETEGVSPTPSVPINTVLVTTINVTDSTISYVPPVIADNFLLEQLDFEANGTDNFIDIGTTRTVKSFYYGSVLQERSMWSQSSSIITFTFTPESGSGINNLQFI